MVCLAQNLCIVVFVPPRIILNGWDVYDTAWTVATVYRASSRSRGYACVQSFLTITGVCVCTELPHDHGGMCVYRASSRSWGYVCVQSFLMIMGVCVCTELPHDHGGMCVYRASSWGYVCVPRASTWRVCVCVYRASFLPGVYVCVPELLHGGMCVYRASSWRVCVCPQSFDMEGMCVCTELPFFLECMCVSQSFFMGVCVCV